MKLNKKNKGKVHPSPPSSSSPLLPHSSSSTTNDVVSALNLLPAAILTLIVVLTPDEQEVLAYLITRSIKATENLSLLLQENNRRRHSCKKTASMFDCGCFDCYTSYWFRWDSSPNRELINQAIEAFEEHLAAGERLSSKKTTKKREKTGGGVRRTTDTEIQSQIENFTAPAEDQTLAMDSPCPDVQDLPDSVSELKNEASPESSGGGNHKGLARKVLPDVIGLFNSRLWSLWNPNV